MQGPVMSAMLTTSLYEVEVIKYPYGYTVAIRRKDGGLRQELDTKRGQRRVFKTADSAIKEALSRGAKYVTVKPSDKLEGTTL